MRGIENRLTRLETKRGPKTDARFYVFGVDENETVARTAAEVSRGAIKPDDPIQSVIWRGTNPPPAPHWATARDLSDECLDDAIATLAGIIGHTVYPRGGLDDVDLGNEIRTIQALIPADSAIPRDHHA